MSLLITPTHDANKGLRHRDTGVPFKDSPGANYYQGVYNKEENAYHYAGYFRGESYAFGIVYVLHAVWPTTLTGGCRG